MDFLKILRSFEEFLFEAATWLLLYPRTLWRIISAPLTTLAYSDREQAQDEDHRYDDALSPPLLLLATLVLTHTIALALHVPQPKFSHAVGKAVADNTQNLVLFRSLLFGLMPLIAAANLLGRRRTPLSREALRAPFYAQCYLAAPCALFASIGLAMFLRPNLPNVLGLALLVGGWTWFLAVQTRWFAAQLGVGWPRGLAIALWATVQALACMLVLLILVILM